MHDKRTTRIHGKPIGRFLGACLLILIMSAAEPPVQAQNQVELTPEQGLFSLDFSNVEISELIKAISKITGKNFLFDETVRGKVTIISPKRVDAREAYRVFETVLHAKGFTTVPSGHVIRIVPVREAKDSPILTRVGKEAEDRWPYSDTFVTRLIPLDYVDADEISNSIVKQLVSKNGFVTTYPPTNTIIIIESSRNINRILGILDEIDSPLYEEVIEIIQLENASAESVAQTLSKIFEASGKKSSAVRSRVVRGKKTSTAGPAAVVTKIIPEERLNALIVMGSKAEIQEIRRLVAKLDVKVVAGKGQIHVVYLQNAEAEKISSVLSTLTAGAGKVTRKAPAGAQAAPAVAEFEGGIKITADPSTNSLIIISSPQDYQTLRDVIDKLDIPRRQVYVEAAIVEVSLSRQRELGFSFSVGSEVDSGGAIVGSAPGGLNTLLISPQTVASLSGLFAGGMGETVTLPDGTEVPSFGAILKALASNSDIDILSTPHLLTSDNEEAQIIIGENVPFITGQNVTAGGVMQTQIQRQDVGITFRITPQINESDTVRLKIYQEISAVSESPPQGFNVNTQGLITRKRSAETTVVVQDMQTVAIGGLIEDQVSESVSRVPILGDIPIIGWFFRSSTRMNRKTNLLIFMTPYIAQNPDHLSAISRRKESQIVEFYREYHPGRGRETIFPETTDYTIEPRTSPEESVSVEAPPPEEGKDKPSSPETVAPPPVSAAEELPEKPAEEPEESPGTGKAENETPGSPDEIEETESLPDAPGENLSGNDRESSRADSEPEPEITPGDVQTEVFGE